MARRALKVCPCTGCTAHDNSCPELVATGRCQRCNQAAEQRRGSANARGYGRAHRLGFRAQVLRDQPLCVCTDEQHGHGPKCLIPSRVADHHPLSRRELEQAGLNPNDPKHGRGLCDSCHNKHTADAQPGGWNAR
jgi:5-methylcytosine-specific restriction protein A